MTTLEAIYENGIFKPVSDAPLAFKEHEQVRISVESEKVERLQNRSVKSKPSKRLAHQIVEETFGSVRSIKRKDLISLIEDEEFSGY